MNIYAHLDNLKRLYQSITTRTPACRIGFPSIIHKSIKTRQTSYVSRATRKNIWAAR